MKDLLENIFIHLAILLLAICIGSLALILLSIIWGFYSCVEDITWKIFWTSLLALIIWGITSKLIEG